MNDNDDNRLIALLKQSVYIEADIESIRLAIEYCKDLGLSVLQKPVHIVPMWNKTLGRNVQTIMPGIGMYRTLASRTGEFCGKSHPIFGPNITLELDGVKLVVPEWCEMSIYRMVKGNKCEFSHREYWIENYAKAGKTNAPNSMWLRRIHGQLAKCVEAQCLRMAFSESIGGLITVEEIGIGEDGVIEQKDGENNFDKSSLIPSLTKEEKKEKAECFPKYTDESFDRNFVIWKGLVESGKKTVDAIIATISRTFLLSEKQISDIQALKVLEKIDITGNDVF